MTARPLFTVVIPTIGRPSLPQTLASIDRDYAEIIVVADMHGPLLSNVARAAGQYGARYLEVDAGRHDTGSPQLHVGFALAEGHYVLNVGDDDVYEPEAFDILADAVGGRPGHGPLMFKVELQPNGARGNRGPVTLWGRPAIERFNVTGQSFVCPNVPGKVGRWVDDVTLMAETVALWGGKVEWREELIARCY